MHTLRHRLASRLSLAAALCAASFFFAPSAVFAREIVAEDSPARLILEVEVPGYQAIEGAGGTRITAPGYGGPSETGAPDLPWMRFQVATGDRLPRVTLEPLEWEDVPVPGGLAGTPRWINNKEPEAYRDAALFAAGRGLTPLVSDVRLQRGMRLRRIALPLGTYAGGESARLLRRFRVRVDFPNPGSAPSPGVGPWLVHTGVKNPSGGRYLTALPRPAALPRLARTAATAPFKPLSPRIRITIGNRELDDLIEDGVYALTYAQLLTAGLPQSGGIPIRKLRVFAGPQDTLGIRMDSLVAPTLREIPIAVEDNNGDSLFDTGDRILFYAHGTSLWKPLPDTVIGPIRWEFGHDPWSFENRYYLQWDGPDGLRLQTSAAQPTADTVATVPHYLRAERDLGTASCDLGSIFDEETGYAWYWFWKGYCHSNQGPGPGALTPVLTGSQLRRPSVETLEGRVADSAVWIGVFTFSRQSSSAIDVRWGGASLPRTDWGIPGSWYSRTSGFSGNTFALDAIHWGGGDYRFEGYTVRYVRQLQWSAGLALFPAATGRRLAYRISGVPAGVNARVLRLEGGVGARWLTVQQTGAIAAFSDSAGAGEDVRYFLHGGAPLTLSSDALALEAHSTVSGVVRNLWNDSIDGSRRNPEYLIIAPAALLPEAVQLRDYRAHSARLTPLNTAVVRVEDIYREWSGGRLSPVAIRDFLRWAVNRWGSNNTPGNLKHVLLFGDGHYDYRNIKSAAASSPNHVPPFNWQGTIGDDYRNPMNTDDFFAVLDSGAHWKSGGMIVSIGRVPVQTRQQAANYLAKIIRYEDPAASGEWRSRILMTGDDNTQRGEPDGAGRHTEQAEGLGNVILARDSGLRAEKLYLFDYPPNASYLKPEATQDLLNQYNRGVLFSTFFGHGAYNQMADEVLLKTNDGLARLRNADKYFFLTIFSCTVGRFDKLADEGMSEQFLRQKDYGAIATVSASRETYASANSPLGNLFSERLFDPVTDSVVMTGDALRMAKNDYGPGGSTYNTSKYILQGEPVLVLNRPGLGLQLTAAPDTLRALGCGSLSGRVTRGSGRGAVSVRIVSGDVPRVYPGNIHVRKRGQILFERTVPYVDSVFSLQYFIPKQVPFGDTAAKIQIFAWDSLELRESALLVSGLRIEGTASPPCMVNDKLGPRIAVTGCNAGEAGEVDFPAKVRIALPYCLKIAVSDTGGGVLAGDGPDQGTTVEVVGSIAPFQPQAGVDDLSLKTYQLPLSQQELAEGTHLLKVTARDGFGNLGQRQITLQVAQDTALRFVRAFNVPNPLKRGETTFWFSTTLPADEGGVQQEPLTDRIRFHVRVFNQSGYMVREFRDARSGETRWDGRDAWGRRLANGVYFYDVTATWSENNGSPQGGRRVSRKNTLVISR